MHAATWGRWLFVVCVVAAGCDGQPQARCGDGVTDVGEDCDDEGESPTCNADCTVAACGDSKINASAAEQCDDGIANLDSSDCTTVCRVNVCGDGKQDTAGDRREECDDGNFVNTDGCSNSCELASCGNGVIDLGEECDDANAVDTDGCASCLYARCGDGHVRAGVEQCDDGDTAAGDGCSPSCTVEACGNGILDANEQCDDHNTTTGDGCSGTGSAIGACRIERCGDGEVNNSETCDRALTPATCNFDCTASSCGDGKVNPSSVPPEQCDTSSAGCDQCQLTTCGNGIVDSGEECDGTANAGPYGCRADCVRVACGNGRMDPGEQCDDGNAIGDDACISDNPDPTACHVARCGDGLLNNGESCDAAATPDTCNLDCTISSCGDGKVNPNAGEECDDKNNNPIDGCDQCHLTLP